MDDNIKINVQNPPGKIVSTIGAGDTLNGMIIFQLFENRIHHNNINSQNTAFWENLLLEGCKAAVQVCGSYDNYIMKKK
jgi:fructokinase